VTWARADKGGRVRARADKGRGHNDNKRKRGGGEMWLLQFIFISILYDLELTASHNMMPPP
jgi:hypothetical protein